MDLMTKLSEPIYQKLLGMGKEKLAEMYRQCFKSTWDTTLQRAADGTVFLITGDIPAMWLRDSSAQVYHYLPFAKEEPVVEEAICKLIQRQYSYINLDAYANAFNKEANAKGHGRDSSSWTEDQKVWVWERKYEIDSLCYPIRLAHAFWKETGNIEWCNADFVKAAERIVEVWEIEQHHLEKSDYFFVRSNCKPKDTLTHEGKGEPVTYTGMTWSGFRPSDDACKYGYLIPANFFAARSLEQLAEIVRALCPNDALEARIQKLHDEIKSGIEKHAVVHHEEFGDVFAYEVDGFGNYHLMDDANVPSLLSLPYLDCVKIDDPVYQNTRRMLLSKTNPYYFEGKAARGIGSPHTPENYVWPISLCIQGLTSNDPAEIASLLDTLTSIDADTNFMHEGVNVDDPYQFTRPWFAWANSIFAEFVGHAVDYL